MKKVLQKIKAIINFIIGKYPEKFLYKANEKQFIKKIMDSSFDWKKYRRQYNPYYLQFGFKFPMYECEYYAANTGVKSDLYLPIRLYGQYIFPYLNHATWRWGYADKNMFARLLDIKDAQKHIDVLLPECIACCDNGRYFKQGADNSCTLDEAIQSVLSSQGDLIIKPSVASGHGSGVMLLHENDKTESRIKEIFKQFGPNFVVQKKIIQHPELAKLNPSSVNTIRITTYQDFNGKVKILYASQRFGGKGKVYDNADDPNGSGGFCAISPDGKLMREIHHYRNMEKSYLSDEIVERIPHFEKVKEAVLFLHHRFPSFALIGWDVSITPEGHPVIIEYNFRPGLGSGQLAHGPMFSKGDLDEIMKRISKGKIVRKSKFSVSFPSKESYWFG